MKKNMLNTVVASLLIVLSTGNTFCQSTEEEAIKECALNYLEGWYSADTARMAKALSPDLAKRGIILNPRSNELVIAPATYAQMLQWVGQKPNELESDPDKQMEVHIIEVGEYIAMVKTITPDFIDYLHMGKMSGEWKIYNAIWERPPQK
ncbi:MAG: nuclear transport factor 2 family protein [Bacteroidota bacterium]